MSVRVSKMCIYECRLIQKNQGHSLLYWGRIIIGLAACLTTHKAQKCNSWTKVETGTEWVRVDFWPSSVSFSPNDGWKRNKFLSFAWTIATAAQRDVDFPTRDWPMRTKLDWSTISWVVKRSEKERKKSTIYFFRAILNRHLVVDQLDVRRVRFVTGLPAVIAVDLVKSSEKNRLQMYESSAQKSYFQI